ASSETDQLPTEGSQTTAEDGNGAASDAEASCGCSPARGVTLPIGLAPATGFIHRSPNRRLTGPQAQTQAQIHAWLQRQGIHLPHGQKDVYGYLLDLIREQIG